MEELQKNLFGDEIIELNCDICKSILSIEPILYNDFFGYVCGRQKCMEVAFAKGYNDRQVLYEKLASLFTFPCTYKSNGCQTKLKWGDAEQHEETCEFKNFACPISIKEVLFESEEECLWIGDYTDLLTHMEEEHINCFFLDSLELNLNRDFSECIAEIYFTRIEQSIVVVVIDIDLNGTSLIFQVYADISIWKYLKYSIKIFDRQGNESTYSSKKKNSNLVYKDCWNEKLRNYIRIDLNHLENFLDDPSFAILEFEYLNVEFDMLERSKNSLSKTSVNGICKTELKVNCCICDNEICPPIFSCISGHAVCNVCIKMVNECPKCYKKFTESRNRVFEKLMLLQDQICQYNSKGCTFVSSYACTKEHENICQFKQTQCTYCNLKYDDITEHIKGSHYDIILRQTEIFELKFTGAAKWYIFFDGQIFDICIDYHNGNLELLVECLGMHQLRYKYDLCLFDTKYLYSEIKLTHLCYPEGINLEKYGTFTKGLNVPYTLLEQIFPDCQSLAINVTIFKLETVKLKTI